MAAISDWTRDGPAMDLPGISPYSWENPDQVCRKGGQHETTIARC